MNNIMEKNNKEEKVKTKGIPVNEILIGNTPLGFRKGCTCEPQTRKLDFCKNKDCPAYVEIPKQKTIVSPWLNSNIMPDIYAKQRDCL